MRKEKLPKLFFQFKSDRFDTIFLFLYRKSSPKYVGLFGKTYSQILAENKTVYYVVSGVEPEFSLN